MNRLGFVHENYFVGDDMLNRGKLVYEISFYFYMDAPDGFEPACASFTEDGNPEYLEWVALDDPRTIYPAFFREELKHPEPTVKHFLTDERGGAKQR